MDDKRLLSLFINGDESALTLLVERYQKELYGFIYRQVGNHADAADLSQKVFVNVFLKAEQPTARLRRYMAIDGRPNRHGENTGFS